MSKTPVSPLLTQVSAAYFGTNCGMNYVIRLSDGRFVIIDGNWGEYDEPEKFFAVLQEQNVLENGPVVAAWFFTHPHDDHFRGFQRLMARYGDQITVEEILFRFPDIRHRRFASMLDLFYDAIIGTHAKVITPSTGDVYTYGDATFHVLFTCEDYGDTPVPNLNDNSLVMRMELAGHRVMWTGDIAQQGSAMLVEKYQNGELSCEILQVPHHGYYGGSEDFCKAVDPEILLWPTPDYWYYTARNWHTNAWLMTSEKVRAAFIAGQNQFTLDLSKPIEAKSAYDKKVIDFDFSAKSVCDLRWGCPTGDAATEELHAMSIEFPEEGVCRLTADDGWNFCSMIQKGQTATADRYSFQIDGVLQKEADFFGLKWNDPSPVGWSAEKEDQLTRLNPTPGKPFSYRLTVDKTSGFAVLLEDGKEIARFEQLPEEPCDLLLVMRSACVDLTRVLYES